MSEPFEIFLVCPPGLEPQLREEAAEAGFPAPIAIPGGVTFRGDWTDVARANLTLRGAVRVLARIGGFPAHHLAQLDKRSQKFPWREVLRQDVPVKVETTTRKSRIYHAGAATQRIETALSEAAGITIDPKADLVLKVRIDDDIVTFSIDTSGESLHQRGLKPHSVKAPMRETLAALFLRAAGYAGTEPVVDPMCGSGTFVLEAAEIAMGRLPGRARSFAFERLAGAEPAALEALREAAGGETPLRFAGSDRDAGAVRAAEKNAAHAKLSDIVSFRMAPISDAAPPEGPPGLVICNPPYGGRIGQRKLLFGLYGAFGQVMRDRFAGWRVAMVTADDGLAKATGLPFLPPGPFVDNGGIKVRLWQTLALRP